MITQYIVDIFKDIADATSDALEAQVVTGTYPINYIYGHPLEVIETLKDMTSDMSYSAVKYPLIALFTDFPERKGEEGIESEVTLNIIIATRTNNNLTAPDRYANTFKPVLYPIYKEFLYKIFKSQKFTVNSETTIPHTKTDRLYWGRTGLYGNTGNLFNDFIDAIEIENMTLKLKQKIC